MSAVLREIKPEALSEPQRAAYVKLRSALDSAYDEYATAYEKATGNAPAKREADYFPNVEPGVDLIDVETKAATLAAQRNIPLADAMRELRGNDVVVASRADRRGAFETERRGEMSDIRRDPGVLMESFERLFAERGYAGASIEAIAQRAALFQPERLTDPALIDDVVFGCVMQTGEQAVNVGRNSALTAGYPETVPATTVDRQCGSSQQAAHFAAQGVIAGAYDIVVAGGVESMSRVPMGATVMQGPGIPMGPAMLKMYAEKNLYGKGGIVPPGGTSAVASALGTMPA